MTHKISFSIFDRIINENPSLWMTLENDESDIVQFLGYLNKWVEGDNIQRLMIYDLPPEFEYMFNNSSDSTLIEIKEEICINLN
tara:strand:- start:234 stop:485 length:252 start_codon:yes stop_codon:yes gene_type:complete